MQKIFLIKLHALNIAHVLHNIDYVLSINRRFFMLYIFVQNREKI